MLNSKGHHRVGSDAVTLALKGRVCGSDAAEWSCVTGLKLRCAGRVRYCYYYYIIFVDFEIPGMWNPRCLTLTVWTPSSFGTNLMPYCPGPTSLTSQSSVRPEGLVTLAVKSFSSASVNTNKSLVVKLRGRSSQMRITNYQKWILRKNRICATFSKIL